MSSTNENINNNEASSPSSSNNNNNCLSNAKQALTEAFQFDSASMMNPLLLVIVSAVAVLGSVCQIIGLNFWLSIDSKGPFTTAAVVAIFWDFILFSILGLWALKLAYRGQLNRFDFLFDNWTVMVQLFIIGALEGAGTLSVSYSALGTNESLQSLIKATVVPATAIFTIFVMKYDPGVNSKLGQLKALCTWQSVAAVVLILGAVAMLAFGGKKKKAGEEEKDSSWLPWICFLGALFNAFHFVLQGHFMDSHTMENKSYDDYIISSSHNNQNQDDGLSGANGTEPLLDDSAENTTLNGHQNNNPQYIDSHASYDDANSVPIIESDLNNNRMSSINVVAARDNMVAGALSHHKHNSNLSESSFNGGDVIYNRDEMNSSNGTAPGDSHSNKRHRSPSSKGSKKRSPFAIRSDDFTVKISMLAVDTFFQIIFTFMCLPFDAIHGFGAHENVSDAWNAFASDFSGLFHDSPSGVSGYFALFLFGWCSSHLAFAYLNHYSPTYTPMVMLLASPITNIILLIIPKWNAHPTSPVVWASIVSALLMGVAAVLFGLFEVGRKKKKIAMMQRF